MKREGLILVIDQGTHASRAVAIDARGRLRASAMFPVRLQERGAGRVEQDATEILVSVQRALARLLADPAVRRCDIACAALATQRSSVLAWDRHDGHPLGPMLSWQDRRCAAWLRRLAVDPARIHQLTGLRLTPHYGASKLRWLLRHQPEVKRARRTGHLVMGPLAAFLLFHLLRERPLAVDHANGQRTQLMNLERLRWDPELLARFEIPEELLPALCPVSHRYGWLRGAEVPLTVVSGDQNAALFALGRPRLHTSLVNIGSGAFVLHATGCLLRPVPGLLTSLIRSDDRSREYGIEGTVNGAGAALEWAAHRWGVDAPQRLLEGWMTHSGAAVPIFINTVGGLGSPWWRSGPARGWRGRAALPQRFVAVAESILFLLQVNLLRLRDHGWGAEQLHIGGGLARINPLCQGLADISGSRVYRPAEIEATARGAAWLAAGGPARWPRPGRGRWFRPQPDRRLDERFKSFCRLLELPA